MDDLEFVGDVVAVDVGIYASDVAHGFAIFNANNDDASRFFPRSEI